MKKLFYLYNGRSALNYILNNQELSKDDEILYPNFSCDVLFQYLDKNYNIKFYDIRKNFKFSEKLIKKKINKKTKIILIINFFGMRQNFKKIYSFCKRKKIILIIDECHTYYDLKKIKDKDFDFKFFSPSKVINQINIGGILQINNKKIKIEQNSFSREINNDYFIKTKQIIKKIIFFEKFKYYLKRPNYENIDAFKSKIDVNNFFLSKKLIKKINSINLKKESELRLRNFVYWEKMCEKLGIRPLLKFEDIKHGCPYLFPAICNDKFEASKIFNYGWKNKIDITSWPTLNKAQKKNRQLVNYWKKIVYFPMHKEFYLNQKLINEQ